MLRRFEFLWCVVEHHVRVRILSSKHHAHRFSIIHSIAFIIENKVMVNVIRVVINDS